MRRGSFHRFDGFFFDISQQAADFFFFQEAPFALFQSFDAQEIKVGAGEGFHGAADGFEHTANLAFFPFVDNYFPNGDLPFFRNKTDLGGSEFFVFQFKTVAEKNR